VGVPKALGFGCVALGVTALVGVAAVLFVVDELDSRAGCGSVDPTDPANYSTVAIRNDTSTVVAVDRCEGGYCGPDEARSVLAPGGELQVDAACGVSGAAATSWRITTPSGGLIGFIVVATPMKHDGLVYPVSHVVASRAVASTPQP
jgi:hypothetical protein